MYKVLPVLQPTRKVLKNFYDVIVFPSPDFALVLGEESLKGGSFPEFCNLSMLLENTKLNSTFFYQTVLKGTGWPDSIFSFISTTVKRLSDLELKCN